ncbi:hypothetical protein ABEF95_005935 [Exophiala dermatitidis]
MSYPSQSSFGDHYDVGNQGQNMQNSYNNGRQSMSHNHYSTQPSYPGDIRQSQYGTSGYDYSRQSQQSYSNTSRQQGYGTESWKTSAPQTTSYGEQRHQPNTYANASTSEAGGQGYYNSALSTSTSTRDTRGLNNLAYASGLEHSTSQRQNHQPTAASNQRYSSAASSAIPDRVQSPVTQGATGYNTNPPNNYGYQSDVSSKHTQQPPVSAAAALAGAVNRRIPQSSTSPVIDAARTAQASSIQRTASPYSQPAQVQAQLRAPSGTPQNYTGSSNTNRAMAQQWSQNGNTSNHVRSSNKSAQQTSVPVNSISNLVTNTVGESPQSTYASTEDAQSPVPSYVDPSKVFNPYHLEHERRRREAEALARQKAAEEAAAAAKKKEEEEAAAAATAARKKREEEEAAKKKAQEVNLASAGREAARKKAAKPRPKKMAPPVQESAAVSQPVQPHSDNQPSETDMAAELKAMMEKMKEFRSKDPTLFQKLWEDMRKPTQGPTVPAAPLHSPSPQMSQQAVPSAGARPAPAVSNGALSSSQALPAQPASTPKPRPAAAEARQPRNKPEDFPGAHRNGYRVVVEDNPEGLPDLGRFPAERRIRTTYSRKPPAAANPQVPEATGSPAGGSHSQASAPPASTTTQAASAIKFSEAKSPPLSQGLPPKGASGGTLWPEDKRNALAEAAVRTLKSLPENSAVEIGPADIHAMLDKNPSYIDLCELLEARGLVFHRGHFARQLLSNVPYLTGPQAKPPQPPQPQSQARPPPLPPGQAPVPLNEPPASLSANQSNTAPPFSSADANQAVPAQQMAAQAPSGGFLQVSFGPGAFKTEKKISTNQQRSQNRSGGKNNSSGPSRPEPPPGSKEAMARKRDFSEVVDLTALSDNEDYVMSRKQARIESPSPERGVIEQYQQQMMSAAAQVPPPPPPPPAHPGLQGPQYFGQPVPFQGGKIPTYSTVPPPPMPYTTAPVGPFDITNRPRSALVLAKPIDKSEALRKTYYNPKTVARDILIAAGRHPHERPLNAHMTSLLGKYIDLDSDLSTFDWDAVDPGGPAVPQVELVDVPTEPPKYRLGERVRRSQEQQVGKVDDTNLNGRPGNSDHKAQNPSLPHSDKRGLPAPSPNLKPQREVAQQAKSKDNLRPNSSQPSVRPSVEIKSFQGPKSTNVVPQKRKQSVTSPQQTPLPQRTRSTRSSSTQIPPSAEPGKMSAGSFFPSGKRRGRPPGAKNIPRDDSVSAKPAVRREISVNIPSPATPSLPVYRCRWKGCKAHLHNLETLRRHISGVHEPSADEAEEYGYICWWKHCRFLQLEDDGFRPLETFGDAKKWLNHIETDHLHPIALKFGDGPSTRHIDPQTIHQDRTRYLSDESGRITTPAVSEKSLQDMEPDTMTLLRANHDDAETMARRSFMKTHRQEKNTPKAVAEETLRAMEARKAALGAGIDKGGCVLVNEARRATLTQNPGIRRVVDANR